MVDVRRPRLPAGVGGAGRRARCRRRHGRCAVRLPDLPAPADRRLPGPDSPPAQRVLRHVPGRNAALRQFATPRFRRRARQVDGADRRRAPADRDGQHPPPRSPARPLPGPARPVAPRPVGARPPAAVRRGRRPRPAGRPQERGLSGPRPRHRPIPGQGPERATGQFPTRPPNAPPANVPRPMALHHKRRALTKGPARPPPRAPLKAIGYDGEALSKPLIGVANTWVETMPCNFHLRALAAKVKEGIREAGGTPMEFNTIAISDGITMGTEGMKASLVSREVIADSIELVARGHMFDGIVALVACDKTIPGAAMALLRLNTPGLVLYGGSILPGRHKDHDITIQDVFEAVGANSSGRIS